MAMKKCERCRSSPGAPDDLIDYCAVCSKDLCDDCMTKGCCGNVPALSGMESDHGADGDESTDEKGEDRR